MRILRRVVVALLLASAVIAVDQGRAQMKASPTDGYQPAEITVPEGFTVELAAGPPLVTHPTMACFDDRGRLLVCNSAGLNMSAEELQEQKPNEIRLLEDTDGDGVADKRDVLVGEFLLWEYPLCYWLERHGYDVTYGSNSDAVDPEFLTRCKALLSVGYDEYWDLRQYRATEAAILAGVNVF